MDGKVDKKKSERWFMAAVMGEDITDAVATSRGDFVVKSPKPADIRRIGSLMAERRGWRPQSAFDEASNMLCQIAATLDVVVVEGPAWWREAKAKNEAWSFEEVPDQKFLAELFGKAYEFRTSVEESFGASAEPTDREASAAAGADEAVGGGIFEGVSSKR